MHLPAFNLFSSSAADDLESALELQPEHSNARQYLGAVQSKAGERGVQLLTLEASRQATAAAATVQQEQQQRKGEGRGAAEAEARQLKQLIEGRQPDGAAAAADGAHPRHRQDYKEGAQQRHERRHSREVSPHPRHGRKRRRGSGSRSRSRTRSSGRQRRQRDSRSRSRSRRRSWERGSSSSSSSGSGSSGNHSDSDTEAAAARLAAAGEVGAAADGDGMDVTKALQIVTSHYKSRNVAWLASTWSGGASLLPEAQQCSAHSWGVCCARSRQHGCCCAAAHCTACCWLLRTVLPYAPALPKGARAAVSAPAASSRASQLLCCLQAQ